MASLTSAARKDRTAVITSAPPSDPTANPGYTRGFQADENAGDSGWMHPKQQTIPKAKMGGPHRKMHAPGFRGRK